MRALANLRKFVGALIGALTRRRSRRTKAAKAPLPIPGNALAPRPMMSDAAAPGVDAHKAVLATPVEAPSSAVDVPAEITPGGETADLRAADPVDSTASAKDFDERIPEAGIPSPQVVPPVTVKPDPSVPPTEIIAPAFAAASTVQTESSTTSEAAGLGEATSCTAAEAPTAIEAEEAWSPDAGREPEGVSRFAPVVQDDHESASEDEEDATVDITPRLAVGVDPPPESEGGMAADEEASDVLDGPGPDLESDLAPADSTAEGGRSELGTVRRPHRIAPWERRPEPHTEYATAALGSTPVEYRTWNRAIAEHLLLKAAGSDLYLTVTPRILARAFAEGHGALLNAEEAQQRFVDAVSNFYRERVVRQRARLRVLRRTGDDGLPDCIGFLGLAVLAAYRMRSDEEASGLAYYVRLAELLQIELSGHYPAGFDPLVFESLWFFLRDWLAQRQGCQLVVPTREVGIRRFVGLPLAHVPLRSLDIEKLPEFFVWAGYQPGSGVTIDQLTVHFARWIHARGVLTPTGVGAFEDARRPAVLAEIRAELDSWDGTCDESLSRRSAWVEILFDPVQHRPELFFMPRRPSGFPARFDDGVHVFEGSDDGWYGRVSIAPTDGPDLAKGFSWQAGQSGVEFALRRAATSVISMTPGDDYSGFMSARGLRRNVQCAVLCQEDVAKTAAEYLSHVAERQCKPLQHRDLPAGWSLFSGIVARRLAAVPAGLESLDVQANVGLIPSGGIRLGNRWSWLQGAPPRIIVMGSEPGIALTVDGRPATVDQTGLLQAGGSLIALGAHVIQVGPVRRTVEIVEPSIHVASPTQRPRPDGASAPVMLALPPGRWTVVGVEPGQIARPKYALRGGTIVACAFPPAWAIRVGPVRGATVLNVFPGPGVPLSPDMTRRKSIKAISSRDMLGWMSSIYDAAVRHPRIDSLVATTDPAAVIASWKTYARCANQLKRAIRKSHR